MSLEHATNFVKRLREDSEFRWAFGGCRDTWERRRFLVLHGYRFSSAELACATSPTAEPTADRLAVIERVRRASGEASSALM